VADGPSRLWDSAYSGFRARPVEIRCPDSYAERMSIFDRIQRATKRLQPLVQPVMPLWRAVQLWLDADGLRMSAAMSFYGMLSLAPLLLLLVGVLGWWLDRSYLESSLLNQVQSVMGERVADVMRQALASAQEPSEGRLASLIGFVVLLSGATGVFVELQSTLARLWQGSEPDPSRAAWWHMASLRLRGLAYVLAIGFLLLVSLTMSTLINLFAGWAGARLSIAPLGPILQVVNEVVAFGFAVALFVGLMRIGTGRKPPLRCLIAGAVVGATLFTIGKQLLAWYLSTAAVVSAYGAAGSLVVLLMWIYFSSAVLLFAASCARALDEAGLQVRRRRAPAHPAPQDGTDVATVP
jgi:membrane protein